VLDPPHKMEPTYTTHIEYVMSLAAAKYITKYTHKGPTVPRSKFNPADQDEVSESRSEYKDTVPFQAPLSFISILPSSTSKFISQVIT